MKVIMIKKDKNKREKDIRYNNNNKEKEKVKNRVYKCKREPLTINPLVLLTNVNIPRHKFQFLEFLILQHKKFW